MKTILILATNTAVLTSLKENLSYFNFDIKTSNEPDLIFRAIIKYKPDLLLIDFILNEGNGGSVCHQVKCDLETRNLPVIMLSEYNELPISIKSGCNACISKPVNLYELLAKMDECLRENINKQIATSRNQFNGNKMPIQ